MATVRAIDPQLIGPESTDPEVLRVRLLFYLGVPALTAVLFGLNQAGMARVLPPALGMPYWLGLTLPLWVLLDLCSRAVHFVFRRSDPHRWLILLAGALIGMAIFSPFVQVYVGLFSAALPAGATYHVRPAFPDAFLDLRRLVAYSGVPICWIAVTLFFAHYFRFPPYLLRASARGTDPVPVAAPPADEQLNEFGLPLRTGFRALIPFHLGLDLVSLSSEDHYVRVVTERGNALIRYRFSDVLNEIRGIPGIQVHRSHWVAISAIERVKAAGKSYQLHLRNGTLVPVSRTYIGLLRSAGLI